jgi:hypothetical protein
MFIVGLSGAAASHVHAEEAPYEMAARYVLETVRAFRTAYVLTVIEHVKEAGIQPKEEWIKNSHAIPLPAQFVKAGGADIDSFELGLISLTPIVSSNTPQTPAEAEALKKLESNRQQRIITFIDGKQFKGMAADIAIVQSCADCHNAHPTSPWRNFKKGDLMGAIVVRMNVPSNSSAGKSTQ